MSQVYDRIGIDYNSRRNADPRIVSAIRLSLDFNPGSIIVDIGAGTGNYSNAIANCGFCVYAVEPSARMRDSARAHPNVHWVDGAAESIPLADSSADGIIAILSIHHFSSLRNAASEFARICPHGPVVVFTFDPRESAPFWLNNYFPFIWEDAYRIFPRIEEVAHILCNGTKSASVTPFPLPPDLIDHFMAAGWSKPEIYLDEGFRKCMSGFALASPSLVKTGIEQLTHDIKSGAWDARYGELRNCECFDAGYRFIVAR